MGFYLLVKKVQTSLCYRVIRILKLKYIKQFYLLYCKTVNFSLTQAKGIPEHRPKINIWTEDG